MSRIIDSKAREERKQVVLKLASNEANKAAVITTVLCAAATAVASYKNKNFKEYMSLSAKVSIPVMGGLAAWASRYEVVQLDAQFNPTNWGLSEDLADSERHAYAPKAQHESKLPLYQRTMNHLYDRPFQFICGVGFPFAALVLRSQLKNKHLTLSQKIMHSRVFAQAGVLSILLSTMLFRDYMEKRGRFLEPEEHDVHETKALEEQQKKEAIAITAPKNW